MVIVINAAWIGIDIDQNHESMKSADGRSKLFPVDVVVENMFCVYFSVEIVIRFASFLRKLDCLRDGWFVFDSILVTMMLIENWVLGIVMLVSDSSSATALSSFSAFRLMRLARLTRMARIIRAYPELMTLIKGIIEAVKSVGFILLFLIFIMYVFAILFTLTLANMKPTDHEEEPCADPSAYVFFDSMGSSLMTLFTNGVLGDNLKQALDAIGAESLFLWYMFVLFHVISTMAMLNMLIGVLCTVISEAAEAEDKQQKIGDFKSALVRGREQYRRKHGGAADSSISMAEWKEIAAGEEVQQQLTSLGVEEDHLDLRIRQIGEALFDSGQQVPGWDDRNSSKTNTLLDESGGIPFDKFVLRLRELMPENPASALDLEILQRRLTNEDRSLKWHFNRMEYVLSSLGKEAKSPSKEPAACVPEEPREQGASQDEGERWLQDIPMEMLFHVLKSRAE
jgi:hypothetical protein